MTSGSAKPRSPQTQGRRAGPVLTLGAGLLAAGALVFTARNFILSRHTFELTEQAR